MSMHDPTDSEDERIANALAAMRANRPLRAEEICRDYLLFKPGSTLHMRLLGHALMKQNRLSEAEQQLRFALALEPDSPKLLEDVGSVLAMQGRYSEAVIFLERAIRLDPQLALAHKKLGQAMAAMGQGKEADAEFREYLELDENKGVVAEAIGQLQAGQFDQAVATLKTALKSNPDNVNALRYLAGAYFKKKVHLDDAEAMLRHATEIAPDFAGAWMLLGPVLMERSKYVDAIEAFRTAARLLPLDADAWGGLGNACARAGRIDESVEAFERSVALDPASPGNQMGYAHVLKTLGDQAASLRAYRSAIRAKPDFGEVYWSMANLKVFRFENAEVTAMEQQLERKDLTRSAEIHFHFALGKAYEDLGDYDRAWHNYHTGNQLQRSEVEYDPVEFSLRQEKIIETFNEDFLRAREGNGYDAADPIFIVGLPRSGSTLIEQILASHSQVEGTSELPILGKIAGSIGRYRRDNRHYPGSVTGLRDKDLHDYGRQYMEQSRRHRLSNKPFFTDKLPNNFPHVGLLHLILPNARIINARRHPLDSCLGAYKQLFGHGQHFTYDVLELAEYYKLYHSVTSHWHRVLPGKVLDVHYEDSVLDLEGQVRRILDYCGLPFEEQCLRFYETDRAVRTASSEQVRQPIYRGSLGKWRRYEKHLEHWREDLAQIIAGLPDRVRDAGA
ncbi:MAG TPA: sulfotransferase [Woeseiaceae bacterium]|nr:sulfotransferase [Woeseiaceae bacterium]